jgi:8-oxo-dGTP diphosphatase
MFTPVLATLGYILSPDHQQLLMIHRTTRPDDYHFGKYNGLGGRLEPGENVAAGMRREILEESGLFVDRLTLRGTISWPDFGKHREGWFVFVFRIDQWHGEAHAGNHEGTLEWVPRHTLPTLPLWPSDRHFLPLVFDDDPRLFHGCMSSLPGEAAAWSCERL